MRTLVVYILFILAMISCKETTPESTSITDDGLIRISQEQFLQNNMALGTIEDRMFSKGIQCSGRIDVPPNNKAVISAVMGGYIVETALLEGDKVNAGDFLVSIENPEYLEIQQAYLETYSQMAYLQDDYQRQKQLLEEQVTSRKKFLKAESDYRTAEARLKGLEQQLRLLSIDPSVVRTGKILSKSAIRSPISGTITKVHVARGVFVEDSDPIMEIVDSEHIHLELAVLERDINQVQEGQQIQFSIPEVAQTRFMGTVKLVGAAVDPVNRTVLVHGHLNHEGSHSFVAGMFVQAEILTDQQEFSSLPEEAVVGKGQEYLILKMVGQEDQMMVFEPIKVSVQSRQKGFWLLMPENELAADDQILIKGAFMLLGE